MRLTYREMAESLGIAVSGDGERLASSVATDNRQIQPGGLFVCIPGNRVDGHDFAADAVARGASLILAQKPLSGLSVPVMVVPNTVKALGTIATLWRSRFLGRVITVTGTCGKTTVKESLAQILALAGKTARTTLNHNNQIGMPCDLLNTDGDETFWVMEAGISHEGDMDDLGGILKPDRALIVNAGAGHTEGLGTKGVAWHKARLLAYLGEGGHALVCGDYPDLAREAKVFGDRVEFFSACDEHCPNLARYLGTDPATNLGRYAVRVRGREEGVFLAPFFGEYGAENVVAITACALELGLSVSQIRQGFASLDLPPQRFRHFTVSGWHIHDDTYNANPLSMRRMIDAVKGMHGRGALVLVMGTMGELGEQAGELHLALGQHMAQVKPDLVFWKGDFADSVRQGLGDVCPFITVDSPEAFVAAWNAMSSAASLYGGSVLFKGSRSNHLENYLDVFLTMVQGTSPATPGMDHVL